MAGVRPSVALGIPSACVALGHQRVWLGSQEQGFGKLCDFLHLSDQYIRIIVYLMCQSLSVICRNLKDIQLMIPCSLFSSYRVLELLWYKGFCTSVSLAVRILLESIEYIG